jgi:hypothetical protein
MTRSFISRLAGFLFLLAAVPMLGQISPGEFTIAALPDTQFYSKSYPQILTAETQWIADHAAQMNIQLVVGLGDIVDSGGQVYQWQNADLAYRILDGKVPYVAAIGNHDYDLNNPAGRTASTVNFNAYFGPRRYAGKTWYKGQYPSGSSENFYGVFTFGGKQYLVLVLECFPRNSALNWAAAVMKNHPGMDTIVVTHAYTYADSTRMDRCDGNSAASFGVAQDNDGEQVWEKFASKYSNITMVLNGHVVQGDGTGRRTDLGVNGNIVNQMLSDYQSWPNGGNGFIRLITVKPALNQVVVKTYSPYTNQWLTDAHNQFTVPYKNVGIATGAGAISGKIKNAADCTGVTGAVVANGYGSTTTDSYGQFSLGAKGPASYGMTVTKSGYMAVARSASMLPGLQSPGKTLVAKTGTLQGAVMYKSQIVPYSKVVLNGGVLRVSTSTVAGANGAFSFGYVPYGTYQISASVPGTTISTTYSVSVTAGGTTYVKFDMQ